MPIKQIINILFFFVVFAFSTPCNANEDIENLIDVVESNGKVIAIIEGSQSTSVNLKPEEKILWSDSSGALGAFLTDDRFCVISNSSSTWHKIHLKPGESETAIATMSPNIVLLVSEDRAISYNPSSNNFNEIKLPIYDELISVKAGKRVAVIITSSRIFGLSANSSLFTEVRLKIKESVEQIKVTSKKVTIRTTDRLLSYIENNSKWYEHVLN
jgi:hypothetical protein